MKQIFEVCFWLSGLVGCIIFSYGMTTLDIGSLGCSMAFIGLAGSCLEFKKLDKEQNLKERTNK